MLVKPRSALNVAFTIDQAIGAIGRVDADWLKAKKRGLTDPDDRTGASAIFAEIRAYGGLLEAGFEVEPQQVGAERTPEFIIDKSVVVEVHAKQQDGDQDQRDEAAQAELQAEAQQRASDMGGAAVMSSAREVHPLGAPDPAKPGDTTTTNAISRVCGIKGNEGQLSDTMPSVLWLDFRSLSRWPGFFETDQAAPVLSFNGCLTSGVLWYAFYGWKGAPVFDPDFPENDRITDMEHPGRYRMQTKLSGAIIACADATVLLEHPKPAWPLPGDIRRRLVALPWFVAEQSVAEWSPRQAAAEVNAAAQGIMAFAKRGPNSAPAF